MRKTFFAAITILFTILIFCSCSDSDNEKGDPHGDIAKILNYPYSKLTAEEQKKKLVNDGKDITSQITGIADESSTKALASLIKISDGLFLLLDDTNDLQKSKTKATSNEDKIIKLSQYTGTYVWDIYKEEWYKDMGSDKLVLEFPAYDNDRQNKGKLELKSTTSNAIIDNHEIPSKVEGTVYVGGNKVGSISLAATGINESTILKTLDATVSLGGYEFVIEGDKNGSNNELKLDLINNSKSILSFYVDLAANITAEMIEDGDLTTLEDANLNLTLSKELALVGFVECKKIISEQNRLDNDIEEISDTYYDTEYSIWREYYNGIITYEEYISEKNELFEKSKEQIKSLKIERIELYNKYTNIVLASTSEKHKIATLYFEFDNAEWDEYSWFYGDYMITYLQFDDNTRVVSDVFFGEGFTSIANMWRSFFEKFQ